MEINKKKKKYLVILAYLFIWSAGVPHVIRYWLEQLVKA